MIIFFLKDLNDHYIGQIFLTYDINKPLMVNGGVTK